MRTRERERERERDTNRIEKGTTHSYSKLRIVLLMGWERQRDRAKTERQRDRKTERQKDRKTEKGTGHSCLM